MRTIPDITDERAQELSRIIAIDRSAKPYPAPESLTRTAFTWHPPTSDAVEVAGLVSIGQVQTFHSWGFYGLFKPSLSEVFAAIQDHPSIGEVSHFWLDKSTVQRPGEPLLHRPDEHNVSGYHAAIVTLYKQGTP